MGSVNLGFGVVSVDLLLFLLAFAGGLLLLILTTASNRRAAAFLLMKIVLGGIFAARAAYIFLYPEAYLTSPWKMGRLSDGGYIVFAGFIASMGATAWYAWRNPALRHSLVLAVTGAFLIWGGGLNVFWLLRDDQVPFPPFTLGGLDGRPVKIEDFIGKPVVVNLWASWCPPCRREMPLLGAAQQRHTDVTFLFVNQGESGKAVSQYLALHAPLLRNVLLDTAGQFPVHVGSQALPVTLFFSARGVLLGKHVGELSEAALGREIDRLRERGLR